MCKVELSYKFWLWTTLWYILIFWCVFQYQATGDPYDERNVENSTGSTLSRRTFISFPPLSRIPSALLVHLTDTPVCLLF